MKICFLTRLDPFNFRSWSGTCHEMYMHLSSHHEVEWIGNRHLSLWLRLLIRIQETFEKIIGRKRGYSHFNKWHCRLKAKFVERRLKNGDFEVGVCANSPDFVAYLNTNIPILYLRDTTFNLFVDYYPSFFDLKKREIESGNEIERLAIAKATKIVYSSEWAAASAVNDYGADKNKITVLPFGANLVYEPDRENINCDVADSKVCNLLFVGVEWLRKGGDVAYKTFKRLKSEGFKCKLYIVGLKKRLAQHDPDVEFVHFLNKSNKRDFERLYNIYSKAHFLLLPTLADCTPIVFSEAAAFGIPVLTNDTGGNSSVIKEGVNGFLFPTASDERPYVDTIRSVFADKQLYLNMRKTSREEFDSRLSWSVWIKEINNLLLACTGRQSIETKEKMIYNG